MNEAVPAPVLASVIGLVIREFSRQPVGEQTKRKAQLEALVAMTIPSLPVADRIVLDLPEGIAVVVLSSPKDALELAERSQTAAADLPLCIGVNHGPIKLISDPGHGAQLLGDGVVAAVTLANLATRGRFLVSRAFHDALTAFAPDRAAELSSVGVFTDGNVRTHELFTLDPQAAITRRRRLIKVGTLAVFGTVGLGVAARFVVGLNRPAIIQFEITPWGDIVMDGETKGRSPPLKRLEASPGRHTIEVHNDPYPPLRLEVNLRPAQEMSVTHSFQKEGFFEGLRRQLGR